MMIIVDSGSTKADWEILYPDGRRELVSTMGFNPYFVSSDFIEKELNRDFVNKVDVKSADKVYFYGAGCSDPVHCNVVKEGLARIFKNASLIEVDHDLLASARASCGTKAGIACIIGTGSNTCLYDGNKILDNIPALSYLIGDEGSGTHLGKLLLRAYFYRELPAQIRDAFVTKYGTDKLSILNRAYGDAPNVYLASYATFFSENRDHFFIQKMVSEAFEELVVRHILKYKGVQELPINFVGSIAYHFKDILEMTLNAHGLVLGTIIRKPIDALVEYHLKNIDKA